MEDELKLAIKEHTVNTRMLHDVTFVATGIDIHEFRFEQLYFGGAVNEDRVLKWGMEMLESFGDEWDSLCLIHNPETEEEVA